MDQEATLADLRVRIKRAGLTMQQVCQEARVAQSTPSRWQKGTVGMTFATLDKLNRAIEKLTQPESVAA